MASLSDRASKQARALARGPRLPEWWPLVQAGLGVIVVLFLGFAFISQVAGDDPPPQAAPGVDPDAPLPVAAGGGGDIPDVSAPEVTEPAAPVAEPGAPDGVPPSSAPDPGDTFDEPTVEVAAVGGSVAQVPAAALERARAVLAASGFTDPSEPTVALSTAQRVVLNFQVDHDGDPATPPRTMAVSVTSADSGWIAQVG